ncbi:hypothetical protein VTP01DRAFT_7494 [Rhizomucor pusillus]|uniref:uncharacterized protein n=1 Tax=Rhizomucor pusillus TaxID=4840 RepID=UPI0037427B6B
MPGVCARRLRRPTANQEYIPSSAGPNKPEIRRRIICSSEADAKPPENGGGRAQRAK